MTKPLGRGDPSGSRSPFHLLPADSTRNSPCEQWQVPSHPSGWGPVRHRSSLLAGSPATIVGASAGAVHCHCGGAHARHCVVLIMILVWFIVVARCIGC